MDRFQDNNKKNVCAENNTIATDNESLINMRYIGIWSFSSKKKQQPIIGVNMMT